MDTTAVNCLVFEKKSRFRILATDKQTNRVTNRWTSPSLKAALAVAKGCLITEKENVRKTDSRFVNFAVFL